MSIVNIARIDDGVVVNLEVVTQDWLDDNADDPNFTFVAYIEGDYPTIGYGYDPVTGFDYPPPPPPE
jgi:hypothetical protein